MGKNLLDNLRPDELDSASSWSMRGASCLLLLLASCVASASERVVLVKSIDARLAETLAQPATVRWHDAPLGETLDRLGKAYRLPLFQDRRLDPTRRVTLRQEEVTLAALLDQLAEQMELAIVPIGPLLYVGPPDEGARLVATLERHHQELGQLPRPLQKNLTSRKPLAWDRLDSPKDLLKQLLAKRLRHASIERVPHDLWQAGALPAMPLGDQLSVLLIGFQLDWEPQGKRGVRFVTASESPAEGWPATPRLVSLVAARPAVRSTGEMRYTLRVREQPLDRVLERLATSAGLELVVAPEAKELAQARVTFSVAEAKLEQLLLEATSGTGLQASIEAKQLRLDRRSPP